MLNSCKCFYYSDLIDTCILLASSGTHMFSQLKQESINTKDNTDGDNPYGTDGTDGSDGTAGKDDTDDSNKQKKTKVSSMMTTKQILKLN